MSRIDMGIPPVVLLDGVTVDGEGPTVRLTELNATFTVGITAGTAAVATVKTYGALTGTDVFVLLNTSTLDEAGAAMDTITLPTGAYTDFKMAVSGATVYAAEIPLVPAVGETPEVPAVPEVPAPVIYGYVKGFN